MNISNRELKKALETLTEDQLDLSVTILFDGELYGITDMKTQKDLDEDTAGALDEEDNHFILCINDENDD
jgi:hypothetical protein